MVSTPFVVCAINSVLAGVIATLLAQQLGVTTPVAIAFALVGVLVVFGLQVAVATRGIATAAEAYRPKFPAPEAPETRAAAE